MQNSGIDIRATPYFKNLRERFDHLSILITVSLRDINESNFGLWSLAERLNNRSIFLKKYVITSEVSKVGITYCDFFYRGSFDLIRSSTHINGRHKTLPNALKQFSFRKRMFFLLRLDKFNYLSPVRQKNY